MTTTATDTGGNPLASNAAWTFDTMPVTVSFATSIQPLFTTYCISCHVSSGLAYYLPLTTGSSYTSLVGVLSTNTDTSMYRVKAGDSSVSVLYERITGVGLPAGKVQMPQGLPPLSASNQTLIKTWIDEGAPNN